MFGLHHLLAPKKDKGELNRIKKNYPIACYILFFFEIQHLFEILSLRKGGFYLLPGITITVEDQ